MLLLEGGSCEVKKILLLVFSLAFLWRFVGINPGYPMHPDEGMSYSQGMAMLTEKTLDAHGYAYTYAYPNGVPIINAIFFKLFFIPLTWAWFFLNRITQLVDGVLQIIPSPLERERIFQTFILGKGGINPLYWGRFTAAIFGFGSVILTYVLGKKLFSRKTAIIWTFLMAANWRMVLGSHLDLPDIYNVFFLLLSLIFSLQMTRESSSRNYILAGVFSGVSFSVKFQFFSYVFLGICYLYNVYNRKKLDFNLILASVFSSFLAILLINPYHFLHWESALEQLTYVSQKYGVGKKALYIYPISYLYHYAVGQLAVFASFLGLISLAFKRNFFYLMLFLSEILFGLFMLAYYSGGGFYTRNLLTLIPFILLFSAVGIEFVIDRLKKIIKNDFLLTLASIFLVIFIYFDQIKGSALVSIFYTKPWNTQVVEGWIRKNVPHDAKIAAHGNINLPIADENRLSFEESESFSIDEFNKENADYAVANFAWATNSFYWWMMGVPRNYMLNYFKKPADLLESTYQAVALRELSESAVFWVSKPWQSPDVNFIVAKVPKYKLLNKTPMVSYNFEKGTEGWKESGRAWAKEDNLSWKEDGLTLEAKPVLVPSTRWESPIIDISQWSGFNIEYRVNSQSSPLNRKGAYVFVSFYESEDDAKASVNRVGVRLSERKIANSKWEIKSLIGLVPKKAKYMTVSYSSYDSVGTESQMNWLKVDRAGVEVDYGGIKTAPIWMSPDDIFPNSHGNL